jgi:hypothetical protein
MTDDYDLENLRATPEMLGGRRVTPRKIQKRRPHFIKVPMAWYERMQGASGQTHRVAEHLLYLHWKCNGDPFKLGNGMLKIDGVSPQSKRRALRDLERRELVTVEWRPRKSPIITLLK